MVLSFFGDVMGSDGFGQLVLTILAGVLILDIIIEWFRSQK